MKKLIFILLLIPIILVSCSKHQNKSLDLSFAGITIGETFPDSLKENGSFKFDGASIPYYEGKVMFALPSNPNKDLSIVAATDTDDKVISIQIGNMNLLESSDFFNMLKSRYGLPKSDYSDTDCSLQALLDNIYKQLGYTPYDCEVDISGNRVIASWELPLYPSDILMIANIYHNPYSYKPQLWTYVWFKYVNVDKYNKAERRVEQKRVNSNRDEYRKKNQDIMNQDF